MYLQQYFRLCKITYMIISFTAEGAMASFIFIHDSYR